MWHTVIYEDGYPSCLSCGGTWEQDKEGNITAANGEDAVSCNTQQTRHGDPREQDSCSVCGPDTLGISCEHVPADCNCLRCR